MKREEIIENILSHFENNENGGDFKFCSTCTDFECWCCKYAKLNKFFLSIDDNTSPRTMTEWIIDTATDKEIKDIFRGLTEKYKGQAEFRLFCFR